MPRQSCSCVSPWEVPIDPSLPDSVLCIAGDRRTETTGWQVLQSTDKTSFAHQIGLGAKKAGKSHSASFRVRSLDDSNVWNSYQDHVTIPFPQRSQKKWWLLKRRMVMIVRIHASSRLEYLFILISKVAWKAKLAFVIFPRHGGVRFPGSDHLGPVKVQTQLSCPLDTRTWFMPPGWHLGRPNLSKWLWNTSS